MKREYLTEKQVSQLTGRALSTLRNDRQARRGFPYVKFGRFVRYSRKDVICFMESRKIVPKNGDEHEQCANVRSSMESAQKGRL